MIVDGVSVEIKRSGTRRTLRVQGKPLGIAVVLTRA